ncbi:hypothetical protein V1504DRAFT_451937 [Lipomyces starkeyi]
MDKQWTARAAVTFYRSLIAAKEEKLRDVLRKSTATMVTAHAHHQFCNPHADNLLGLQNSMRYVQAGFTELRDVAYNRPGSSIGKGPGCEFCWLAASTDETRMLYPAKWGPGSVRRRGCHAHSRNADRLQQRSSQRIGPRTARQRVDIVLVLSRMKSRIPLGVRGHRIQRTPAFARRIVARRQLRISESRLRIRVPMSAH